MSVSVKINGTEASNVLEGLSITYGRQKSEGSFPASSCSLTLLAADVSPFTVEIRDVLTIDVDGIRVFYGRVTDRQRSVAYSTNSSVGTYQSVIATGVLADFGRILIGSSLYPSETDGARASRIIGEAAPLAPSLDSISTYIDSVAYSFDVFRVTGIDTVDSGTVTLISRAANAVTPRQMIDNDLDPNAPGVYETPAGKIGYADATRRPKSTSALSIPASVISQNLVIGSGVSDVVNQAKITYGSGTVTVDEPLSQAVFGIVKREITTQLSTTDDATNTANRLVQTRGFAEDNLETLPIDLENPNLHPSVRGTLLGIAFNKPIIVTGLDVRLGLTTSWRGFVEGWSLRISRARAELQLYVSARRFSIPLSALDPIYAPINALTGSIDDLSDLWSSQPLINYVSDTINSVTATLNTPYTIGA